MIPAYADLLLLFLVLLDLYIIGTGRLVACVRGAAAQGALLSLLPLTLGHHLDIHVGHTLLLFVGTLILKGLLIPYLLMRTIVHTHVRREVEPFVSLHASVLLGALLVALSFWLSQRLTLPRPPPSSLLVPAGLSTLFCGFLLLVSRKKAITQVVGYLMLENGIFVFAQFLTREMPIVVEMGILLDVLVGVFVMGIAINHINREFDHIDTAALTSLRD